MQRKSVVGTRSSLLWLLILIAVVLVIGVALVGLVILPQLQATRAEQARLAELERHYQAGVALQSVEDWTAAEAEYKQVVLINAGYKDAQARLVEVKNRQTTLQATATVAALTQAAQAQAHAQATAVAALTATVEALEAHYQKGIGYLGRGRWQEAKAELEQVFAVNPGYKDIQARLVEVEQKLAETKAQTPTAVPSPIKTPAPAPTTTLEPCRRWNLAADFRIWPNQENPNRDSCGHAKIWYFMGSATLDHTPSTYYLLPKFAVDNGGIVGLISWYDPNNPNNTPSVGFNATGSTQRLWGEWPPKTVFAHPAPSKMAILGWRSPINGWIRITGSVTDKDSGGGDGINWYVEKGETSLTAGYFDNGGRQEFEGALGSEGLARVAVNEGDFIYLLIHPRGRYEYDSTFIDLTIEQVQ